MNSRMAVVAGMVCGVAWLLMPARSAMAQMPPVMIAVCDPMKILGQILEGKVASGRWKVAGDSLNAQAQQKQDQLKSEEESVKLIMPGSADYDTRIEKLTEDEADAQAWLNAAKANLARRQRNEQKQLFAKIQDAIKQVAMAQGITMVINASHPEFPDVEKMDANAFIETIMLHVCLYADDRVDITQDVAIALDKAYKAGPPPGGTPGK